MAAGMQELEVFVREALARGESRASVAAALQAAGWPEAQVQSALGAWADVPYPVPVPRPRAVLSARDAFLYLVLFATLYVSAYHLGSLLFDLIELRWTDAAEPGYRWRDPSDGMRFSVASVLIAFPVFLFMARLLSNELARNPAKRLSAVRRWLTYLTLFIAAGILVGDMITLVYNVLGGELTARFVLKVLVVAVIAGTIFGFYLGGLRTEERES